MCVLNTPLPDPNNPVTGGMSFIPVLGVGVGLPSPLTPDAEVLNPPSSFPRVVWPQDGTGRDGGRAGGTAIPWGKIVGIGLLALLLTCAQHAGDIADTVTSREQPAEMRVQLQSGVTATFAIPLNADARTGVTTRQVRDAMLSIYAEAKTLNWFPYTALEPWLRKSIIEISQELNRFPPLGVSAGAMRTIVTRQTNHNRRNFRIDVENLRGTNLRL